MKNMYYKDLLYKLILALLISLPISVAVTSVLFAIMVLVYIAWCFEEKKIVFIPNQLDKFFLFYIALEFITAFNSNYTIEAIIHSKRLLLISFLYLVVLSFNTKKRIETAIYILAIVFAIVSLFEIGNYFIFIKDRLHIVHHPLTSSGMKMIVALFIIPYLFDKEIDFKNKSKLALLLFPIIISLLLTKSRSSLIAFVIGSFVIGVMYNRKIIYLTIFSIIMFYLFAPQHLIDRVSSIYDLNHPNNIGRLNMWKTGIEMWKDKPILGFGDIDLYKIYIQYRVPTIAEPAGHLHNNFLQILVSMGLVGFTIVNLLFYKILQMEFNFFKKSESLFIKKLQLHLYQYLPHF